MKIINLIFESRIGGPQLRIVRIAEFLNENYSIKTTVIAPTKNSKEFEKILKKKSLDFFLFPLDKLSKNPFIMLKWLLTFIPQTIKLIRVIKRENPDIVHVNGSWQWKGVIAAKILNIKVIWHLNDTRTHRFVIIIFKKLIKRVDGIIFAGNRVREYYGHFAPALTEKIIIQAPVDTSIFNPGIELERTVPSNSKKVRIITVANLNPVKGIDVFIKAANELNKTFDNLEFNIYGEFLRTQKKYITYLKEIKEDFKLDNLFFKGFSKDVVNILKNSDIYICSSMNEAAPMSVWEAMAMKKPIVSTDVGSVSTFIKNGVNGFVVPIGDHMKISEKVEFLLKNRKLWQNYGDISRKIVKKELDISKIAELHKNFYEVIGSSKNRKNRMKSEKRS